MMKLFFNGVNFLLTTKVYIIIFSAFFLTLSCSKNNDPEEINEEEEINRVSLTFVEGSNTQTYTWNEDSNAPSINLEANKNYQVSIYFYDASDPNDIENITEEVIEEADEHFVFFELAGTSNLTIQSSSNDISGSDGVPINLYTDWTTGDSESGTIRVFLIHEPTKKIGTTRTDFGGETDVELDFPLSIQ